MSSLFDGQPVGAQQPRQAVPPLFAELLQKYPGGFAVTPSGKVMPVVAVSDNLMTIAESNPLPPDDGGYLVVRPEDV
jgi:hypothetical protein